MAVRAEAPVCFHKATSPLEGRRIAEDLIRSLADLSDPEMKRLGRLLAVRGVPGLLTPVAPTTAAPRRSTGLIGAPPPRRPRLPQPREHYRLRMLSSAADFNHLTSDRKSRIA